MRIPTLPDLCKEVGTTINRLMYFKKKNMIDIPEKIGLHVGGYYEISEEFISDLKRLVAMTTSELANKTILEKWGTTERGNYRQRRRQEIIDGEANAQRYIESLEQKQRDIDEEYDKCHGLLEWE